MRARMPGRWRMRRAATILVRGGGRRLRWDDLYASEQVACEAHRQADDVRRRAGKAGDERVVVLDAVPAGLAAPLAAGDVVVDLLGREELHPDGGHLAGGGVVAAGFVDDAHAGDDEVRRAGEELEHLARGIRTLRLAKDDVAEGDDRVGAEDDVVRVP